MIHAAEVVVPPDEVIDLDLIAPEIDRVLEHEGPGCRFTLGLLSRDGGIDHVFRTWEPVSGGYVLTVGSLRPAPRDRRATRSCTLCELRPRTHPGR